MAHNIPNSNRLFVPVRENGTHSQIACCPGIDHGMRFTLGNEASMDTSDNAAACNAWLPRLRPRRQPSFRQLRVEAKPYTTDKLKKAAKKVIKNNKEVYVTQKQLEKLDISKEPPFQECANQRPSDNSVIVQITNCDSRFHSNKTPPSERCLRPAGSQEIIPSTTTECDETPDDTEKFGPHPCNVACELDGRKWVVGKKFVTAGFLNESSGLHLWQIGSKMSDRQGFVFGHPDASGNWSYLSAIREGGFLKFRPNEIHPTDINLESDDERVFFVQNNESLGGNGMILVSSVYKDQAVSIGKLDRLCLSQLGSESYKWVIS